jgi:cobalt-zinc-cadmium efflux system outer membrane protein
VLERGGKRRSRQAAGEARVSRAVIERDLLRLELLAETTRRFTEVAVAQAETKLAAERLALAQDLGERVERQVEAARRSEAEAHSARMDVGRARLARVRSAGALEAARIRLAALWGATAPAFERAEARLFDLPPLPSPTEVIASLAANPDLLRLASEQRIAQAEAELARSQSQADVTISAGAKYYGELDAGGIILELSMPLGTRSRAEPVVRAAEQRSRASELAAEGRRRQIQGLVSALIARLDASRVELSLLQEAVIPEAERAAVLYREGFEAGRHSFITLAAAQHQLIEARRDAIVTASAFHRLRIELETLIPSPQGALP